MSADDLGRAEARLVSLKSTLLVCTGAIYQLQWGAKKLLPECPEEAEALGRKCDSLLSFIERVENGPTMAVLERQAHYGA